MRRLALPLILLLLGAAAPDERRYMFGSFDRIRVDGPYDVAVSVGAGPRAIASGTREALAAASVRVENGLLTIAPTARVAGDDLADSPGIVHVAVTVPRLRAAQINGSGRLAIDAMRGDRIDVSLAGSATLAVTGLDANDLRANLNGTGNLTLAGKARALRVASYGAGSVDAAALTADDATAFAQSSGSMTLRARFGATVSAIGLGAVSVLGPATCTVRGPGPVTCEGITKRAR